MEAGDGEISISFRDVTKDDLRLLMTHRNQLETKRWLRNHEDLTMEKQLDWFNYSMKSYDTVYKIAMSDSNPVGLLKLRGIHRSTDTGPRVGVEIFRDFRGKGFGRKVLEAGIKYAKSLGVTDEIGVILFVNNFKAVNLYLSSGFKWDEEAPVRFFIRNGVPQAYARMYRKL